MNKNLTQVKDRTDIRKLTDELANCPKLENLYCNQDYLTSLPKFRDGRKG